MTAPKPHVRPDPNDPSRPKRGVTDTDLIARQTVYRADLLAGQTVVITGGGSGMGKASAMLAARLGANVAICGRSPEKLDAVQALIKESVGSEIFTRPLTIRDPDAVEQFLGKTVAACAQRERGPEGQYLGASDEFQGERCGG